jgi:hypothetical protein
MLESDLFRLLQPVGLNCLAIESVSQRSVGGRVNVVGNAVDRTVTENHLECRRMCGAEKLTCREFSAL